MLLKSLDFAKGVTEAPRTICYGQSLLCSVDFTGVTKINDSAFYNCTSLESITLPESLTSIDNSAFSGCTSLKSVTLPENLTSLSNSVFSGCTSLESVTLPESLTSIGSYTFYGCTSLKSVTLPENLTSIGNYAFHKCTSLESIVLPESLTSLGDSAFYGCSSLTGELIIPSGVTKLNSGSFVGTKFDLVVFPAGVTIVDSAFSGCSHPTVFDFSACTAIPSLSSSYGLGAVGNGQVLKIPTALFDAWSTKSQWSSWAAQMVAV